MCTYYVDTYIAVALMVVFRLWKVEENDGQLEPWPITGAPQFCQAPTVAKRPCEWTEGAVRVAPVNFA